MTKFQETKSDAANIEMHPDGWDRFRNAVHKMAKTGTQHRESAKPKAKGKPSRAKGATRKPRRKA